MSTDDKAIFAFTQASADLLQVAMAQAQRDDPEGADALARALQAGATVSLRSTFAPAVGIVHLTVHVDFPSGESQQLMALELQREAGR